MITEDGGAFLVSPNSLVTLQMLPQAFLSTEGLVKIIRGEDNPFQQTPKKDHFGHRLPTFTFAGEVVIFPLTPQMASKIT